MKRVLYGLISCSFIFGILIALYVLTGGDTSSPSAPQPVQASPNDSGFKDLKIN